MRRSIGRIIIAGVCLAMFVSLARAEVSTNAPLRAAIFVQNRGGEPFKDKVGVLNDMISTRLTERGFSILDKNDIAMRFQETKEPDVSKASDAPKASDALSVILKKALVDLIQGKETKTTVESTITDASALRLSQMLGADYLVFATINSVGREQREFKGKGTIYGTDSSVVIHTLRVAIKVLDGGLGGSLYGDLVTVNEKTPGNEFMSGSSDDTLNKLLDLAAIQIAGNIEGKVDRIRAAKAAAPAGVEISINSNIEGSSIALDGAVIGEVPGKFTVAPGLHQMLITKEFCKPWERTVNLFGGQVLNVTLELSDEGLKRFKDVETFKLKLARDKQNMDLDKKKTEANIDIARQQSEAEAYATKQIAEGEKKKREESYIRSKGFENK